MKAQCTKGKTVEPRSPEARQCTIVVGSQTKDAIEVFGFERLTATACGSRDGQFLRSANFAANGI